MVDNKLNLFKENALKQAHAFDVHKILPEYEDFYKLVIERSKVEQL